MAWLFPSVIAHFSGSSILVWVYGFLYFQHRERHLGLWAWAWGFSALRLGLAIIALAGFPFPGLEQFRQLFTLFGGLFLFWGTSEFIRVKPSRIWLMGGALGMAWIYYSHHIDASFLTSNLPLFIFLGVTSIWTGVMVLRSRQLPRTGRWATGIPLTLWGLHQLNYPFLRPVVWFAPWGYMLAAILSFMVAGGLLTLYFQRVRKELSQSEFRFRTLFEQAPVGIFLHDLSGKILDANDHGCTTLGYSRMELSELSRQEIEQMIPPETFRRMRQQHPGSLGTIEGLYHRRDGSPFPIELRVREVLDWEHGPCLLAMVRDISQHKEAQGRLQEQNNLLSNVLSTIPHSVFWKDRNSVYQGCNENFARNAGLASPGEIIGKTDFDLPWKKEEAKFFRQCDEEVMEKNFPLLDLEEPQLQADGKEATVLTSKVPLADSEGAVIGILGIYNDITERRRAEEALRKSETRHKKLSHEFMTLLNGIPDSLMLLSEDHRLVWTNKGTAEHLRKDFDSLPGNHCYELWQDRSTPCEDCIALKSFSSGKSHERIQSTPDGRAWGTKVFPIKNGTGQVVSVIHLASDITEKTRLREQAERAGRLASLGELAAGVAHEINNPNGLILLNMPLIREAFEDAKAILDKQFEEYGEFQWAGLNYSEMSEEIPLLLKEMEDGSRRISHIVEDLKNFASKDPQGRTETFDFNTSVQKAVRLASNNIKRATDQFEVQYAEGFPPVQGSSQRIEQVVVNLIVNACLSLDDRSSEIRISTSTAPSGDQIILRVIDQGCGISAADLPHVTDPFFTTRRELGGTGLGLSISARIVKEHSGSLHFESTPGEGTTVSLSLPIHQKEELP